VTAIWRHYLANLSICMFLCIIACEGEKKPTGSEGGKAGDNWTVVQEARYSSGQLNEVIWTGTQFMAVGGKGHYPSDTAVMITSPEGSLWTEITVPAKHALFGIGFNGEQYIITGHEGAIFTSQDGLLWREQNSGISGKLGPVIRADDMWIAIADVSAGGVITSTNGVVWTKHDIPFLEWLSDVVWNGSIFVTVGWRGQIFTSPNRVDWTRQNSKTTNSLMGIAWDGSQFVTAGGSGEIIKSPDGTTWSSVNSGTTDYFHDIVWSDTKFAAVGGAGGSSATIAVSPYGNIWTSKSTTASGYLFSIAWSGMEFVAVGDKGLILKSP